MAEPEKVGNTNNYLEQCSNGLYIKSDCHSTTYTKKKDILIEDDGDVSYYLVPL
jgi:hypothetical protein